MIPVAIYARYSTDKQDARSIEDQLRRCREYCERHGMEVVAEFADAATSGAHTERANLRRMLDVATATKRPPFQAVIVDDLSRLSRDLGDTWRIIFTDLAAVDVRVIDASTGMASDASGARTMFAAMAMVNDTFLQLVRHETHRGLQGRALAGFCTGGSLYGFTTHDEPNPTDREHPRKLWEIDETEAAIVRRIYALFAAGKAYRAIADQLNREGVPRRATTAAVASTALDGATRPCARILTNEKYVGRWLWNASKWIRVPGKRARRQIARPASEHVVREYPDLAIIDRETFDLVQSRMTKRRTGDEPKTRAGQQTTLVSGLLRCGACGGPMSVRSAKVKNGVRYVNYGCTSHSSRGGAVCPNGETISERKASEAVITALHDVLTGPAVAEVFKRGFDQRARDRAKLQPPTDLEKQLGAAKQRVANATRLFVEMPDDLDLRRQRDADRAEVKRIESELNELRVGPATIPDRKKVGAAISQFLKAIAEDAPERGHAILARCITPVSVGRKVEGPYRFSLVGAVNLAAVAANVSSGGRI